MKKLVPGERFGDYTIVRLLGRGGMGEVWLLRSDAGNDVAAKILDPDASADAEARKRFLREAQLALGVKHPNLVETYDVGEDPDSGLCYILMEYVPGGTLSEYLKANGALPIEDAVAVVQAISAVLESGRQKGIVHRDIKPANIMFAEDGTPKLADLGIARGGIGGVDTTTVTQTGAMIGTPAYMAPEQMMDAHHVDTRADVYSLGVVFFEMLTGQRPNKDDTIVQLMAKAVKGEPLPDVRSLRPEVSASLAQLLTLMVAPDRDGRIATPGQVVRALDVIGRGGKFLSPQAVARLKTTPVASAKKSIPWGVLLPAVILTALGAAFYVLSHRDRPQPPSPSVQKPVAENPAPEESVPEKTVPSVVSKPVLPAEKPAPKAAEPSPVVEVLSNGLCRVKVEGSTWTYQRRNEGAVIRSLDDNWWMWTRSSYEGAVTPRPTGRLVIPATLGGQPVIGIEKAAISHCPGLTSVEIPEGVRFLGVAAFNGCPDLVDVRLPESIAVVSGSSFCECAKLEELDLRLCRRVGGSIVRGCPAFSRFRCDSDNPHLATDGSGALYDHSRQTLLRWPPACLPVVLPSSVTTLGEGSLSELEISGLVIPKSVVTMRKCAFSGLGSPEVLVVPASVRSMDMAVFHQAARLKCLVFEGDAPVLENECRQGVFDRDNSSGLTVFLKKGTKGWRANGALGLPPTWPDGQPNARRVVVWETMAGLKSAIKGCGATYPDRPQTTRAPRCRQAMQGTSGTPAWMRFATVEGVVWKYQLEGSRARIRSTDDFWTEQYEGAISPCPTGHLIVPSSLDGHPVASLGIGAFSKCRGLKSVELPEGLRFIGLSAFDRCPDLEEIRFPQTLEEVWERPFTRCGKLKQLDIRSCRKINGAVVFECPAFEKFVCDPGNPSFETDANGALYDRGRQTLHQWPVARRPVRLPESVTCLGRGSLSCMDVRQFVIPRSVVDMKGNVFHTCRQLEVLMVPRSVRTIEDWTFHGLIRLKALVFEGDAPTLTKGVPGCIFEQMMPPEIVVFIRKGTKGWRADGKPGVPSAWPDGAANARRVIGWKNLSDLEVALETLGVKADLSGWSGRK